jgi:hypothetical protein
VDISDTGMSSSYFSTMPGENLSTDRANHCHIKALGYVPASASVTSGGAAPPERVSAKDNARGRRRPLVQRMGRGHWWGEGRRRSGVRSLRHMH